VVHELVGSLVNEPSSLVDGRAVEGNCLENSRAKASGVRIPLYQPRTCRTDHYAHRETATTS
jgi:hypothetical protein